MDMKKIIGLVITALLSLGIGFAAKSGIEVKCPAEQSVK